MKTYHDSRSKRAIAIDKALNAKKRHSDFNEQYANSPNRSDVVGYDTKGGKITTPPQEDKPEPKPKEDYIPTPAEKQRLAARFHKLAYMQQHKDLLTTRNVIKKKSNLDKWKKNPRQYDVRGIDTRPPELLVERFKVIKRHAKNPRLTAKKFRWKRLGGDYQYKWDEPDNPGSIRVDTSKGLKKVQLSLAHEYGHAYDRNVIAKVTNPDRLKRKVGNVTFENIKRPKMLDSGDALPSSFVKVNNKMVNLTTGFERNRKQVIRVTEKKINPYDSKTASMSYNLYRKRNEELFANWFAGLVINKNVVKRHSRGFYNTFKKSNKPLFRDLRTADFKATKKYTKR